jgi:hypothetical protein
VCGRPGCADARELAAEIAELRRLGGAESLRVEAGSDAPWSAVAQVVGAACAGVSLGPPVQTAGK